MADPVTLTAISVGATVLGGATQGIGSIMGGESKSSMYKYQAGVARVNQEISKQNADYSRTMGEREAQSVGMKSRFQRGQIITAQSGRGLAIGSGSNADVVESQGALGRHDQATVRASAAKRAYGYEVEAFKQGTQASMYDRAAEDAETAGYIGAFSSLLGTASSVAGKWLDASRLGIGSGRGISFEGSGLPLAEWEG